MKFTFGSKEAGNFTWEPPRPFVKLMDKMLRVLSRKQSKEIAVLTEMAYKENVEKLMGKFLTLFVRAPFSHQGNDIVAEGLERMERELMEKLNGNPQPAPLPAPTEQVEA